MNQPKADDITEVLMEGKRKAYEKKLETQLKEWNAQIALLKAKAENARADANVDFYKTIDDLARKRDEARTKLQELKTAGDDAWEDVKAAAEKIWTEFKTGYHEATSRFK